MNQAKLDALRLKLIRNISEIEDEEVLSTISHYIATMKSPSARNYPYAPSKEELHRIIEEVLEDERNGKFITLEELREEMKTW